MKPFLALVIGASAVAATALSQGRGDGAPVGDDLALQYFATADYDASGWISISEARSSLSIDRKAFAQFDTDHDGLVSPDEFIARYHAIKAKGGAFAQPIPNAEANKPQKRTAAELIQTFDTDRDGALDEREVQRALDDYKAHGVEAAVMMAGVDKDGSRKIEAAEAQALLDVLAPAPAAETEKPKAGSIAELFDKLEPRKIERDQTPQPARITGPVTTFRRLDFDDSGGITVEDLEHLQRPLILPVRCRAVLAALDTDGNGEMSPEELDAALK
jgi:Ca2+-binding EF-hand superfamily protein